MRSRRLFGLDLETDFPFATRLADGASDSSLSMNRLPMTWGSGPAPAELAPPVLGAPAYRSPLRSPDDEALAEIYRYPDLDVYRFPYCADFYLWRDRLHCQMVEEGLAWLAEIRFLGPVMAWWLERQGLPCLHASAVVGRSGAAAFLASHGGGKTTLAAALLAAGRSLVSDDIVPLELVGGTFQARAGYPQMRMEPDAIAHFAPDLEDLPRVHPGYSKLRLALLPRGPFRFHAGPASLQVVYVPRRHEAGGRGVEIRPLPPSEALIELVRHSFLPHAVEALGLQPRRLALLAQLVERIPVRELAYPSGFEHLEVVTEAILRDFEDAGF